MYWVEMKGLVFITRVVGLRVVVEGLENIPAGVCMFAANQDQTTRTPPRLTPFPEGWRSLKKNPIRYPHCRLRICSQNSFPWTEGTATLPVVSVKQAIGYMYKEGFSFLVYPEGTRSPDGRLQRFKKGAFVMAIEAGVPIVPVACSGRIA